MAGRRFTSTRVHSHGAAAALLLAATCCTLPAFASKPAATISETAAAMKLSDSAPARFLAPRAEAAIRNAFGNADQIVLERRQSVLGEFGASEAALAQTPIPAVETDAASTVEDAVYENKKTDTEMNARLPGISDEELIRYKKLMFRNDI
jgi:hypothetical protein